MSTSTQLDTHSKALAINLDPTVYGTIAEIGAGQEVARWLLSVGGASGTIAQTISAYDKTFSDATYGAGTRYVSRERLFAMLDHEYRILLDRLAASRGATTRFFVFAETASARNFKGDNEQHAWVGLRFQIAPGAEPSELLLHVSLRSPTAALQQQVLGTLGVNLIHAIFFHTHAKREVFLGRVWEGLTLEELEVDAIEFRGPAFASADLPAICLALLRLGMSHAVLFDAEGRAVEPSSVLRKRPVVVERIANSSPYPFAAAIAQLRGEKPLERDPVGLLELSIAPFAGPAPTDAEVTAQLPQLTAIAPVLLTGFSEAHYLSAYLHRFTAEPVRLTIEVSQLARILHDRFTGSHPGQLLETLGKLLRENMTIYARPSPRSEVIAALGSQMEPFQIGGKGELVVADDLQPPAPVVHLYRYLRDSGRIAPLTCVESQKP